VPDTNTVLALVGAGLGSTVLGAAITAIATWRLGVRGDERTARAQEQTARRDTVADRDALIDQLQAERDAERDGRLSAERELRLEEAWTRLLVDHVYRRQPPPPPTRPTQL